MISLIPRINEKSYQLATSELPLYTFTVKGDLDKPTVAKAIEKQYGVTVVSVNMINLPGKARRFKGIKGHTKATQKAIVRLAAGQKIADFSFEAAEEATSKND